MSVDNRGFVGFPQIDYGFYPGGGIFDSISKNHPLLKIDWRKRNKFSIEEALSIGLIHGCYISEVAIVLQTLQNRPKHLTDWAGDLSHEIEYPEEPFSPAKLSELTKSFGQKLFVHNLIHKPHKISQRFTEEKKYRHFIEALSAYQYLTLSHFICGTRTCFNCSFKCYLH